MPTDLAVQDPPAGTRPMRCAQCGRAIHCSPTDFRVYSAIGPPPCCGKPMTLALDADRPGRRRPARPGARIEARRGAPGVGPDLADALVDVCEDGIGVRLTAQVLSGEELELGLRRPRGGRAVVVRGTVRWCRPTSGGHYQAGIKFARPLTAAEVNDLAR